MQSNYKYYLKILGFLEMLYLKISNNCLILLTGVNNSAQNLVVHHPHNHTIDTNTFVETAYRPQLIQVSKFK